MEKKIITIITLYTAAFSLFFLFVFVMMEVKAREYKNL